MPADRTALVVGASRGLGLVLAGELVVRGWEVIATTRAPSAELQMLADSSDAMLRIEGLEMTDAGQLTALRERLADIDLDLVFVNAAINRSDGSIDDVTTDEFTEVMITNALSPLRVLAALRPLVVDGGTVAVMSSDQGSITLNDEPGYEVYKASKAALNQLMRSYATRHADDKHTKLLLDPGHNRTELGGPDAPLDPRESISAVVDVLEAQSGAPGLQFLDRVGGTVPW